jgi:hypothetical protein
MAQDKDELYGLFTFLENVGASDKDAEEALKKARIDPKDYGMKKAKELVDYWRKSVKDLTEHGGKK